MEIRVDGYMVCDGDIADIFKSEGVETHRYLRGDFLVTIFHQGTTTYISDFAGSQSYNIPRNSTLMVKDNQIVHLSQNITTTDLNYVPPQGIHRAQDYDTLFEAIDDAVKLRVPNGPYTMTLSSGHDSGTIATALLRTGLDENAEVLYAVGNEDMSVLNARLTQFNKTREFKESFEEISKYCDPHVSGGHYALAKNVQHKIMLSGLGADELYVSGDFQLMRDFLRDAQRAYRQFGIQARFPLLDPKVYRAYHSLDYKLMNMERLSAKTPLFEYMKTEGFPVKLDGKSSFFLW